MPSRQRRPDRHVDPVLHQYEYSPSYNDFGHTDDNAHFWRQMDFLTPELLRVLQPGRVCAVHVKDRITPGGINGFGFQTVTRISDACADHFERHGFAFLARKTDRHRRRAREQPDLPPRLDGAVQGRLAHGRRAAGIRAALPEAADRSLERLRRPARSRRQGAIHAGALAVRRARLHALERQPLLRPRTWTGLPQDAIFKLFKKYSLENVYDFERDVALAEHVDRSGWLPSTFMLMPPQSWHPDVWTDVTRMRTLNASRRPRGARCTFARCSSTSSTA
jgi:hypothetical protein